RDLVTETVSLDGIPVQLVDTAGIRQALDEAESIGIKKSMEALADADLVLVVTDASQAATLEDEKLLEQVQGRGGVGGGNKSDLTAGAIKGVSNSCNVPVRTSALTGEGIAELRSAILQRATGASNSESGFLTNARHQALVSDSLGALDKAEGAVALKIPHEML